MDHSCSQIEPLLAGYVDGELADSETKQVESHLNLCRMCGDALQDQRTAKTTLHQHYRQDVAPVHLRVRLRHELAKAVARQTGFFESLAGLVTAHKVKSAFAALALVVLLALPYSGWLEQTSSSGGPTYVLVEGQIVCLDCEIMHEAGHNKECHDYHHMGLRDGQGNLWRIVDSEQGADLITNRQLIGQRYRLEGYTLPGSLQQNIDVRRYEHL